MNNKKKLIIFILAIILVIILSKIFGFGKLLVDLRSWIAHTGLLGMTVFVLVYIISTIFAVPASILTIAAGTLFGSLKGVIIVSIASTGGCAFSFLAARYFARGFIHDWIGQKEKFQKLDSMTREHGHIIVAVTRLLPIFPYILLNYGFGLTSINFWKYVFWSWICMLPGTIMFVVGTDAVTKTIADGQVPWILIGIFIFAIALITFIVRNVKKKIKIDNNDREQ